MQPDRLIFFGTGTFSVPSLEKLLSNGYNVVAVITKPDKAMGRHRRIAPPAVKTLAEAAGIPVLQPSKLSDLEGDIQALRPTMGIVVAYGNIIPKSILSLFPKGLVNVHASLLPKYRGASPIEATILNGDTETGVSLMKLNEGLDTGPVYATRALPLRGNETRPELFAALAKKGGELLVDFLPQILAGSLAPIEQDETNATAVRLVQKADGAINWDTSATWIARQIRAYMGWPGSRTRLFNQDIIITAAQALPESVSPRQLKPGEASISPAGDLLVGTTEGVLLIERLKPAGKTEMTAQAFLRGRKA